MSLVLDASVVLKWLLKDPVHEEGTVEATELMQSVMMGQESVLQPVHWHAEVGAVLARLSPKTAKDDIVMVRSLEFPVADDPDVWRRACELAIELKQHMFDALYHAVALATPGALLVTADHRYLQKARRVGRIVALQEWHAGR